MTSSNVRYRFWGLIKPSFCFAFALKLLMVLLKPILALLNRSGPKKGSQVCFKGVPKTIKTWIEIVTQNKLIHAPETSYQDHSKPGKKEEKKEMHPKPSPDRSWTPSCPMIAHLGFSRHTFWTSWNYLGHIGLSWASLGIPSWAQNTPTSSQNSPKVTQILHKYIQHVPKMAHPPKISPRGMDTEAAKQN